MAKEGGTCSAGDSEGGYSVCLLGGTNIGRRKHWNQDLEDDVNRTPTPSRFYTRPTGRVAATTYFACENLEKAIEDCKRP